ncbi:hypothetical protein [Carnobacterium viridans]|uniref:hypothetical protein n=1 Tax=Carnobacterium viridans TaxID=174587 RepID=UPI00115FF578|nr:hypothetical protein [Carnobacterium viridans]
MDDSVFIILTSYDAINITTSRLRIALERIGGTGTQIQTPIHRSPFALLGIAGIGKGSGIEMISGVSTDSPYAEIASKVINGVPQGINNIGNATLEKFTTLEATVNGINTVVGTKANQSQVTQLATQVSTKVESATYNSKMTQLDSAINLRVVQGDVTEAILSDKTVKDTRYDNQFPSWYYANYPKQTVEEFKLRTTVGIINGSASYGQLTTKVPWDDSSGGAITQTFSSGDGVFQRISNGDGSWLAWDKIAESGKLISQINVSTEGILLQGKRIQLDGDVTMTSAFVDILDVKTLSAVYADPNHKK